MTKFGRDFLGVLGGESCGVFDDLSILVKVRMITTPFQLIFGGNRSDPKVGPHFRAPDLGQITRQIIRN